MPSEFDSLSTISDWSTKLAELLDVARAASTQDENARLLAARRLIAFVAHVPRATPDIQRLNQLATSAARALAVQVANEAADRIAARTSQFDSMAADLRSIRAKAEASSFVSSTQIADCSDRLALAAADAAALARLARGIPDDPEVFQTRMNRLAAGLSDLQAVFRSLSSRAPEPSQRASGTVIPEVSRAMP